MVRVKCPEFHLFTVFIFLLRVSSSDGSKFNKWNTPQLDEELDETGCPKHKLALLCGPPGLGKTTLAHVIAKHGGNIP